MHARDPKGRHHALKVTSFPSRDKKRGTEPSGWADCPCWVPQPGVGPTSPGPLWRILNPWVWQSLRDLCTMSGPSSGFWGAGLEKKLVFLEGCPGQGKMPGRQERLPWVGPRGP